MNIYILSHRTDLDGPIDYYEAYLLRHGHTVTKLSHPLITYQNKFTLIHSSNNRLWSRRRKGPYFFNLAYDFFININKLPRNGIDTVIGANNFDTVSALFAKLILRKQINKIIYFGSDYSEERYSSALLNNFYILIEKIALKHSDLVISNTKRAENKRFKLGLDKARSIVVPNGVQIINKKFNKKRINKTDFIYVGSITREHGVYELVKVIAPIINSLTIIGSGNDLNHILHFCKEKGINHQIISNINHDKVISFLQQYKGMGLAPYNLESKWTYYCSPLKVSEYIACGVPVLISNVPEISVLIQKAGYGVVYTKSNLQRINKRLNEFDTHNFNQKSKNFYDKYNSEYLFSKIRL